ncbi:hypothetical protein [Snodgrassella sp. CFCC 13594]|uniref:hypothetical protein n=1 Tax=Snodgrassella sp. CFCC 13594 TaxID=1775559 RepID=UPI0008323563|nr:hypothetical protein [Snodgrassella sp. CFCC 13594]
MPNYCTGPLKIRGKKENVLKYMNECIAGYSYAIGEYNDLIVTKKDVPAQAGYILSDGCLKGAQRCFAQCQPELIELDEDNDSIIVMINKIDCAWVFDIEGFKRLSAKYEINFKFFGFESGMEFNLDVEIINGVVIKAEEITFENYRWECLYPTFGG